MILHHLRIQQTRNSTRGVLLKHDLKVEDHIDWVCEILEDGYRELKNKDTHGLVRIDAAMYEIVPIQYGKFYDPKSDFLFAIALMDKKGVDRAGRHGNVRVHKGGTVKDTDGCPLTAIRVDYDPAQKNFFVVSGSSTPAFLRLYNALLPIYDRETNSFKEPAFWKISEQFV